VKNIDNTPNFHNGQKHDLTPVRFRGGKSRSKCGRCGLMTGWRKPQEVKPQVKEQKVEEYDEFSDEQIRKDSLYALTVPQLRDQARDLGIAGYSKMNKTALVDAIAEQGELIGV